MEKPALPEWGLNSDLRPYAEDTASLHTANTHITYAHHTHTHTHTYVHTHTHMYTHTHAHTTSQAPKTDYFYNYILQFSQPMSHRFCTLYFLLHGLQTLVILLVLLIFSLAFGKEHSPEVGPLGLAIFRCILDRNGAHHLTQVGISHCIHWFF